MSTTRPFLSASLSTHVSSSSPIGKADADSLESSPWTYLLPRPNKRRLVSAPDLKFFTPAEDSFKPKPYAPNGVPPGGAPRVPMPRHNSHSALAPPAMDPTPDDPGVLFLHPRDFRSFPGVSEHPEGLSYAVLAENPEWFLDPLDYHSTLESAPGSIPYPPILEPPRGWCPQKKKDLKERGPDGWPEGEEPRLRCTCCRRTYAGVNAKSMWRRHVFEKHKIAMSNRREGSDRTRTGRGANKENRSVRPRGAALAMQSQATHAVDESRVEKRIYIALPPARRPSEEAGTSAPTIPQDEFSASSENPEPQGRQTSTPPESPTLAHNPLTPARAPPSPHVRSSDPEDVSSMPVRRAIPPSPYDPTATPSFRHSTPPLPSDQPWRFPSPSHPLHSRAREFPLSTLARDTLVSPLVKMPSALFGMQRGRGFSSPSAMMVASSPGGTPDSLLETPALIRESPGQMFDRGAFSGLGRPSIRGVEESPLRRSTSMKSMHTRQISEIRPYSDVRSSNNWLSSGAEVLSSPSARLADPIRLDSEREDPFGMYGSWREPEMSSSQESGRSPPTSSPEVESPVLRSSQLPSDGSVVGLGISLMAPFGFYEESGSQDGDADSESELGELMCPDQSLEDSGDEDEVDSTLRIPVRTDTDQVDLFETEESEATETRPPLKKRRTVA